MTCAYLLDMRLNWERSIRCVCLESTLDRAALDALHNKEIHQ